jgi:hypothetical protein
MHLPQGEDGGGGHDGVVAGEPGVGVAMQHDNVMQGVARSDLADGVGDRLLIARAASTPNGAHTAAAMRLESAAPRTVHHPASISIAKRMVP